VVIVPVTREQEAGNVLRGCRRGRWERNRGTTKTPRQATQSVVGARFAAYVGVASVPRVNLKDGLQANATVSKVNSGLKRPLYTVVLESPVGPTVRLGCDRTPDGPATLTDGQGDAERISVQQASSSASGATQSRTRLWRGDDDARTQLRSCISASGRAAARRGASTQALAWAGLNFRSFVSPRTASKNATASISATSISIWASTSFLESCLVMVCYSN
jgi:hypothetical protein